MEREFTGNRGQHRKRRADRAPRYALVEAVKLASGLANPSRANDDTDAGGRPAGDAVHLQRRKFADPAALPGNLAPIFQPIADAASNVGIAVLNVRRNESRPDQ